MNIALLVLACIFGAAGVFIYSAHRTADRQLALRALKLSEKRCVLDAYTAATKRMEVQYRTKLDRPGFSPGEQLPIKPDSI